MSELGDSCFPSHETIAEKASLARSTVASSLKLLIEKEWLERKSGGGRGKSNRYSAAVPDEETVRQSDGITNRPATDANRPIDGDKPSDHRTLPRQDHVITTTGSPGTEIAVAEKPLPVAQEVVCFFVDESRRRGTDPTKRVVGQMAKYIKELLDEGRTPREIALGIRRMLDRRVVQPAMLSNFVTEAALPLRKESRPEHLTPEEMLRRAHRTRMREHGQEPG